MFKLPFGVDANNLIDDLRIFSWEAADIFLFYSQLLKDPNSKSSNIMKNDNVDDPVTLVDLKVNELIIDRINQKYPSIDWGILSEENTKISSSKTLKKKDWLWVFDPLDGTKDFLQGSGDYAMHLALNYKQKSFIGLVLIPEKNELWITNGKNTWCESRDGKKLEYNLSHKINLNEMTIVTSKNHSNLVLKSLIEKINFRKIIHMGSIGCKISSILRGESDIYISLSLKGKSAPKDWDFAAPAAILKAAGGAITNLDNQEISYNQENYEQRGLIIASSNSYIHGDICSRIKDMTKEFKI